MTKYRLDGLEDLGSQYPDTKIRGNLKRWTNLKTFELRDEIDTADHLKEFAKLIFTKAKNDRDLVRGVVWEKDRGRYRIQRLIL